MKSTLKKRIWLVRPLGFILCCLFGPTQILAQENPISSDRPGQANSAQTVGQGNWQWQMGLQFNAVSSSIQTSNVYLNEHQLRYGLLEDLDAALLLNFDHNIENAAGERLSEAGFSTLGLRLRHQAYTGQGFISAIGWQFDLLLPPYREFQKAGNSDGHWTGMLELSPGGNFGISLNGGIRWTGEMARPLGHYVLNLNYSWGNWSAFAEHYSFQAVDGNWPVQFDGGLAYYFRPNLILDLSIGQTDFNGESNRFVNLGFSWRWKNRSE